MPIPANYLQRQIYKIDLEGIEKYVLVVSREELNRGDRFVTLMFTTQKVALRSKHKNCVFFKAGSFGLTADCVLQCESISTTYEDEIIDGPIGTIDSRHWAEVIKAMGFFMDSKCYS